jgi:ABC-type nitrate/sulfonate/bicarbonate transport system ATPase subunit
MSRILAHNISKYYDTEIRTHALTNFTISVADNEFVCLVGPSGCGKSTFLNLVAGFIEPSQGELRVAGKPVNGPGPDRGVVFQEDALFPWSRRSTTSHLDLKCAACAGPTRECVPTTCSDLWA